MAEYEKLVKRLRDKACRFNYDGWVDTAVLLEEAADAIFEAKRLLDDGEAQPVVKGKWIFKESDVYPWCDKAICSCCNEVVACNAKIAQDWGKIDFVSDNKFCPNCGAKMEGNDG